LLATLLLETTKQVLEYSKALEKMRRSTRQEAAATALPNANGPVEAIRAGEAAAAYVCALQYIHINFLESVHYIQTTNCKAICNLQSE
jgi:hypothetical protein